MQMEEVTVNLGVVIVNDELKPIFLDPGHLLYS